MAAVPHLEFPPPVARICKRCHIKQPISVFALTKRSPDGRGHICKDCRDKAQRRYEGFDPREITSMIDRALKREAS